MARTFARVGAANVRASEGKRSVCAFAGPVMGSATFCLGLGLVLRRPRPALGRAGPGGRKRRPPPGAPTGGGGGGLGGGGGGGGPGGGWGGRGGGWGIGPG